MVFIKGPRRYLLTNAHEYVKSKTRTPRLLEAGRL